MDQRQRTKCVATPLPGCPVSGCPASLRGGDNAPALRFPACFRIAVVFLGLFLGSLLFPAAAISQESAEFDAVRDRIERALAQTRAASLTVAVARDGEIIWEEGFGWADRERRRKADPHTMYSLASISKPITATGLMVLVERGKLDLDRPANDFLGSAKLQARVGDASDATLRRLATHTAGLPLHYQFFYADEPTTPPVRDESIRRYGHLMFEPNWRYQYANFGYGVLDYVIERASGRSYADFMRREVFVPLDMTRTSVGLPPELSSYQAVRYYNQRPLPFYDFDHPGASAVYSSAHDLVRFGMFHLKQHGERQKTPLQDASIEQMQQPSAWVRDGLHYGLGWFVNEDENGFRTVSHTGGMGGVRTRLVLVPDKGIAVVALCNSSTNLPLDATTWILSAMLPKYERELEAALAKRKEKEQQKKSAQSATSSAFEPKGGLVGMWKGEIDTYQGRRDVTMEVQTDGDVHVQLDGQLKTLLNEPRLEKGCLWGVLRADVGTDDANRRPYHLHLRLRLRDTVMNGACRTISLSGDKPGNALSYWMELRKQPQKLVGPRTLFSGHDLRDWRVATESDFERHGKVEVKDGQVVLGAGRPATGIAWRGDFPRLGYALELEAKRLEGGDFFCGVTFPVGPSYCTLVLGGWGGGVTGLSNVDNMAAVENETTDYVDFKSDRWYRIRLHVGEEKIEAWVDQKKVVDLESKGRKFSIWWEQEPMRPLGIASWRTRSAIRNIRIKPLPGAAPSK